MIQKPTYANVYKQIYDIVLNTSRALQLLTFCVSQGDTTAYVKLRVMYAVVTRLRCGEKYGTSLVANLLLCLTAKEFLNLPIFLKVINEYRVARF